MDIVDQSTELPPALLRASTNGKWMGFTGLDRFAVQGFFCHLFPIQIEF